jgi:hypothetical protein
MTVTGRDVSASIRLMAEPVISTRSSCCDVGAGASCANAGNAATPLPKAIIKLVQSFVLFNIGPPKEKKVDR